MEEGGPDDDQAHPRLREWPTSPWAHYWDSDEMKQGGVALGEKGGAGVWTGRGCKGAVPGSSRGGAGLWALLPSQAPVQLGPRPLPAPCRSAPAGGRGPGAERPEALGDRRAWRRGRGRRQARRLR